MRFLKRFSLQFFGDEEGGMTETAGESSPAAEESVGVAEDNTLSNLGVPKDKVERFNRARARRMSAPLNTEESPMVQPAAPVEAEARRLTWDEIMKDPEYNKSMQDVVNKRLKKANAAAEKLRGLAPALELLGSRYNIDATDLDTLDIEALNKAINEDHLYYEEKAAEMGTDTETAMKVDRLEREEARRTRENNKLDQQRRLDAYFQNLTNQGNELKKIYPSFDLNTELKNPRFARMVGPGGGVSVQDAFFAIHRQEIQQAEAQSLSRQVTERVSNAIQAGQRRPVENGSASVSASSPTILYSSMSKSERDALKSRIREAAARGEHLKIGG